MGDSISIQEMFRILASEAGDTVSSEKRTFDLICEITGKDAGAFTTDGNDNYFLFLPTAAPVPAFTSHLDIVDRGHIRIPYFVEAMDGRVWGMSASGTLGADDRAGITIMCHMIRNDVPGLYCFFSQEEGGGRGSHAAAIDCQNTGELGTVEADDIKCMVSFDRKGYNDVITRQKGDRCASDEFGKALAASLGDWYDIAPNGSFTDSASFVDIIPECSNISVGYFHAHTMDEKQDISFLSWLAAQCVMIDWRELPISRDPSPVRYAYKGGVYTPGEVMSHEHSGSSSRGSRRSYSNSTSKQSADGQKKKVKEESEVVVQKDAFALDPDPADFSEIVAARLREIYGEDGQLDKSGALMIADWMRVGNAQSADIEAEEVECLSDAILSVLGDSPEYVIDLLLKAGLLHKIIQG